MLDTMLAASSNAIVYHEGLPPLTTLLHSSFSRSHHTLGLSGQSLIMSGGFAAPPNPYPQSFPQVRLMANGLGIASFTNVNNYDGSGPGSAQIGGTLWLAQGHDGAYRKFLKARTISTGAQTVASSQPAAAAGQTSARVVAIDNNTLFWGHGQNTNVWQRDGWKYTISTDSWASVPLPPSDITFQGCMFEGQRMSNGKLIIGRDGANRKFITFDPVTNTYAYTASWLPILQTTNLGRLLVEAATASVGKYVLFFEQGYRVGTESTLSCLRYDCETDSFDVIDFPGVPARWGARCAIDADKGYLYIVGGITTIAGTANLGTAVKFDEALVFPLSQFLI